MRCDYCYRNIEQDYKTIDDRVYHPFCYWVISVEKWKPKEWLDKKEEWMDEWVKQ